jgi:hypothetical protein
MTVYLRALGSLQRYLGSARLAAELPPGATLRHLLDLIDARWGEALPGELWDRAARRFCGPVVIMSGGADLREEGATLAEGEEILLLLPLAGG